MAERLLRAASRLGIAAAGLGIVNEFFLYDGTYYALPNKNSPSNTSLRVWYARHSECVYERVHILMYAFACISLEE
jgi:hypothetical protein